MVMGLFTFGGVMEGNNGPVQAPLIQYIKYKEIYLTQLSHGILFIYGQNLATKLVVT